MKYLVIALAAFFSLLTPAFAVDATAIDAVRTKATLTDADGTVIDQFVAAAVREMLDRTEFGNISSATEAFAKEVTPAQPNPRYTEYFTAAAARHFKSGLAEAEKLADATRKKDIKLNLLIMLERVGQLRTAVVAENEFDDAAAGVQYWAVKCVLNPAVVSQLNAGTPDASKAATDIASRLKAVVPTEGNPAILGLIADWAGAVNAPETADVLVAVANKRIREYEDWTVSEQLIDGKVLEALGKKVKASKPAAVAYGQLLSDCMQRYARFMASSSTLGEQDAFHLATTLTTVERGSLSALLGPGRVNIQNAMAKQGAGLTALNGEYALLFGSAAAQGELTRVLGVRFPDAQGREQALPRPLPDRPGASKK
jgi:hypothetical protein